MIAIGAAARRPFLFPCFGAARTLTAIATGGLRHGDHDVGGETFLTDAFRIRHFAAGTRRGGVGFARREVPGELRQ